MESADAAQETTHAAGHVVDHRILIGVLVALLVLTVVTVGVTKVDLGAFNLWAALVIAGVKVVLVALYFMHLRYDHPFNAIVFVTAILFLLVFIGLAMMDTLEYQEHMRPGYAPNLDR